MELEEQFRNYIRQYSSKLSYAHAKNIQLIQTPSSMAKPHFGDFRVFMKQPPLVDQLIPHIEDILIDLPEESQSWSLQISEVVFNPKSPYLELYLRRPPAFEYVCKKITAMSAKASKFYADNVLGERRLHLVITPCQSDFDRKRSDFLLNYSQTLYRLAGFEVIVHKASEWHEKNDLMDTDEFSTNAYYNTTREGIDLGKFLVDRELSQQFDPNIGILHKNDHAVNLAFTMKQHFSIGAKEAICYIGPHSKGVLQERIALLLMVFGWHSASQTFVVHGGFDGGNVTFETYEERVGLYVSHQLCRKRITGIEHIAKILKDTKLIFELLGIKQQNRVKTTSIIKNSDLTSFEGKGGLFVQYTCSRLIGLMNKYDRSIKKGMYAGCAFSDKLCGGNLEWTSLSSEQEWVLLKSMLKFVELLEYCTSFDPDDYKFSKIDVKAHSICNGLLSLCKECSIFYSKVRVLVESQSHVFPTVQCRIYFVMVLHKLLKCGLMLLGLEAVERM